MCMKKCIPKYTEYPGIQNMKCMEYVYQNVWKKNVWDPEFKILNVSDMYGKNVWDRIYGKMS